MYLAIYIHINIYINEKETDRIFIKPEYIYISNERRLYLQFGGIGGNVHTTNPKRMASNSQTPRHTHIFFAVEAYTLYKESVEESYCQRCNC